MHSLTRYPSYVPTLPEYINVLQCFWQTTLQILQLPCTKTTCSFQLHYNMRILTKLLVNFQANNGITDSNDIKHQLTDMWAELD